MPCHPLMDCNKNAFGFYTALNCSYGSLAVFFKNITYNLIKKSDVYRSLLGSRIPKYFSVCA